MRKHIVNEYLQPLKPLESTTRLTSVDKVRSELIGHLDAFRGPADSTNKYIQHFDSVAGLGTTGTLVISGVTDCLFPKTSKASSVRWKRPSPAAKRRGVLFRL